MDRGEIRLKNETLAKLDNYLVVRGVPLPPGAAKQPSQARIVTDKGKVLPSEGKVLQRRPDGSIEWLLMDILVPLKGQEEKSVFVEPRPGRQPAVDNPVKVSRRGRLVTLSNGISEVTVSKDGGSLIRKLVLNGRTIVDGKALVDLEVIDGGGKIHRASLAGRHTVTVTHQNRLRTELTIEGKHRARDGEMFLDFALRFTLTANSPDLKLEHTFYCREDREGLIRVKGMRLVMPTTMDGGATKLVRQVHHGHDWFHRDVEIGENIDVVASSVGDIDNYAQQFGGPKASHPCAGGSVFVRNGESMKEDWNEYPFHMRPGQGSGFREDLATGGLRAVVPVIGWKDKANKFTLVTTFEHFRQLHPKSIEIDENEIVFSIWPQWSIPMQIVQGVSKSHIFWLTGEPKAMNMHDVLAVLDRWEYGYVEPVDISFDPAWPRHCQALECHEFLEFQPDRYPLLENLIEPVPAAGNPERHTYDRLPSIGMFHFGDSVSDDAKSCANNEDDCTVLFPLQHFLRTGQTYAWDQGKETARHYMEVDFCEWSTDPRQNGGLIPHTGNHFVGNVYPSHQWAEGILAYYYLSGDERAKKVVIACGDNNVWWAHNKIDAVACDNRTADRSSGSGRYNTKSKRSNPSSFFTRAIVSQYRLHLGMTPTQARHAIGHAPVNQRSPKPGYVVAHYRGQSACMPKAELMLHFYDSALFEIYIESRDFVAYADCLAELTGRSPFRTLAVHKHWDTKRSSCSHWKEERANFKIWSSKLFNCTLLRLWDDVVTHKYRAHFPHKPPARPKRERKKKYKPRNPCRWMK